MTKKRPTKKTPRARSDKRRVNFAESTHRRSTKPDVPLFDKSKRREQQFAFDFFDPQDTPDFDDDIPF